MTNDAPCHKIKGDPPVSEWEIRRLFDNLDMVIKWEDGDTPMGEHMDKILSTHTSKNDGEENGQNW